MNIIHNQYIYYQNLIPDVYHSLLININNIISNYSLYQSFSDATFNGGSDWTTSPRSCIYQKNNNNPNVKFGLLSVKSTGTFEESSYTTGSPNLAFRIKLSDNTTISPYQQTTNIPSYIYNEYIKTIIAETPNTLIIYLQGLIILTSIIYFRGFPFVISFAFNIDKSFPFTINRRYSYIYNFSGITQGHTNEIVITDTNYQTTPLYAYDSTMSVLSLNQISPAIRHTNNQYYQIPKQIDDVYVYNNIFNTYLELFNIYKDNTSEYMLLGGSESIFIKI